MHKKTSHIVNGLFCKPLHTYLMNIHVKHNLPLSLSVQSFGAGFHVALFLSDILLSVFPVKNTKRHCKIQNMFIINGSWSKGIVEKKNCRIYMYAFCIRLSKLQITSQRNTICLPFKNFHFLKQNRAFRQTNYRQYLINFITVNHSQYWYVAYI